MVALSQLLLPANIVLLVAMGCTLAMSKRADVVKHSNDPKEITYIRHGKSTGNAGVWGAFAKGSATAYRDGTLMPEGKEQIRERVELLDGALFNRFLDAEVVLVSPLRRTLATALLLLGHLEHRRLAEQGDVSSCGGIIRSSPGFRLAPEHQWPQIQVVAEMREKIKTDSEVPGSGDDGDPMIYVRRTGEKVGERLFCDKRAMDSAVLSIVNSYAREAQRTVNWTVHLDGIPEPKDGWTNIQMISAFKKHVLAQRDESRVVMVGHSGWSRYAFSHLMPAPSSSSVPVATDEKLRVATELETQVRNLARGSRKVMPLNNGGVMCARFVNGVFQEDASALPDPEGLKPGTVDFPNFDAKGRMAMLGSLADAKAAGVVPEDSQANRFFMNKIGSFSHAHKKRIFTLSAVPAARVSFISWADKWGDPKGYMEASGGNLKVTLNAEEPSVIVTGIDGEGDLRESEILADTKEELEEFVKQLELYQHMFDANTSSGNTAIGKLGL